MNTNPVSSNPDSFPTTQSSVNKVAGSSSFTEYELTVPFSDPSGLIFGLDVNNQNQMLFRALTQNFNGRAFVYHPDEGLTEIISPDPGDRITATTSINELGQVIGTYYNPEKGIKAFT